MKNLSHFEIRWSQFFCLGIWQLIRHSYQTRMNRDVRSLIWIHKVVENHQEVLINLIGVMMKKLSHFQIRWSQFSCLWIWQLLRHSYQTRMNRDVRSLIWINKVVENHKKVWINLIGVRMKKPSYYEIGWSQFSCLGIWQLLRYSNQTRMNRDVRSCILIHKVVENIQEVE